MPPEPRDEMSSRTPNMKKITPNVKGRIASLAISILDFNDQSLSKKRVLKFNFFTFAFECSVVFLALIVAEIAAGARQFVKKRSIKAIKIFIVKCFEN